MQKSKNLQKTLNETQKHDKGFFCWNFLLNDIKVKSKTYTNVQKSTQNTHTLLKMV